MPTEKLTALRVDKIRPPAEGRIEYFDSLLPGFGLRVSAGGSRTWTVFYRHQGRKRRMSLGSHPALSLAEAREAAKDVLKAVEKGNDPAAEKRVKKAVRPETFDALADAYIERYAKRFKRAWKNDEAALRLHVRPEWRCRPIPSISRADVIVLLEKYDGHSKLLSLSSNHIRPPSGIPLMGPEPNAPNFGAIKV